MAICAAHSIADFAEKRGITIDNILPNMLETELFPHVAANVAMQAIKDGVARKNRTWDEVYEEAKKDIQEAHAVVELLQEKDFIKEFPEEKIREIVARVSEQV